MKIIRISALLVTIIALLTLLPGCGGAETEPEAPTAAQAPSSEPIMEPTTEPTTEATTVSNEPPTLLEEAGHTLWDGATSVSRMDQWQYQGQTIPVISVVHGKYEDIQMQFAIVGSDRKEYRDMVNTDVDILLSEIPGEGFDDGILWISEKLEPFHGAYQKRESSKAAFEEWATDNLDQKLLYAKVAYTIHGTDLYLKTIEDGVKMKDLKVGHSYPDLVDAQTGAVYCIREAYDPYKPEVGCWKIDPEAGEAQIQAWFTRDYSWDVQEGKQANIKVTFEYYVLVPADYDGISFCMQEYATADKIDRLILGDSGKSWWGSGSIFDEEFVSCVDYRFHFFGLKGAE